MTATENTLLQQSRIDDLPVRLRLKEATAPRGLLDGAWWPRSRDLAQELPALAAVLDPTWHRITRVAVNPLYWQALPRKVAVAGHVIKVSWFTPELDRHKMLLLSYTVGRWDLLVIPPETTSAAADRLMAAVTGGPPRTASALMADEEGRERAEPAKGSSRQDRAVVRSTDFEEVWEDEGGASTARPAAPGGTSSGGVAIRA